MTVMLNQIEANFIIKKIKKKHFIETTQHKKETKAKQKLILKNSFSE